MLVQREGYKLNLNCVATV